VTSGQRNWGGEPGGTGAGSAGARRGGGAGGWGPGADRGPTPLGGGEGVGACGTAGLGAGAGSRGRGGEGGRTRTGGAGGVGWGPGRRSVGRRVCPSALGSTVRGRGRPDRRDWRGTRSTAAGSPRSPAGIPPETAAAARGTLGGAVGAADRLPAGLLETAGDAFVQGLHLAALTSAAVVAGMAVLAALLLGGQATD
jgi:hypothetical protein